ncbi:sugar-binding domain-containing protein [Proteiniborus sp. MB09-C3]|uniref:sugar-binding transcriptional regulator n=1 Tax=Proteiniborus sp. MB09-C3 TaxID=3050072 RepID=UPI002553BC33|nr:sugar-binding domain-containing protein [Proteiniborus sp. MB09-C3]WIV10385.1 sugar-binding domain-containing protein [Proteiniborus sp. MB09-C3]
MKDLIELQRKIAPEIIDILEKRYSILRNIYYNQPIGRRALANNLGLGERVIRTEVSVLKEQGLLDIETNGMNVTEEGKLVIDELKDYIHGLKGLNSLEKKIKDMLSINRVYIVPGDSREDMLTPKDIGKTASILIKQVTKDGDIIGITGGTTMAQVAEEMTVEKVKKDITVIPARGGLGKDLETQSNNIAAKLAKKLGGSYRLLQVPDNVGVEALKALMTVHEVKEVLDIIKNMDILVFGIGRADVMAERRELQQDKINEIEKNGAVAEAFGHYFNTNGDIVLETSTIGLSLEDFKKIDTVIGVAGGKDKAEAIVAICKLHRNMILIIDEAAARKILSMSKNATI